jgi:hypothetical protein
MNDRATPNWLSRKRFPKLPDRNSKPALLAWAAKAIADLPATEQLTLLTIARREIENDGLRGDVSTLWMARGYTTADIPDLYP